jgi:hypothetical protein
LIFTFLIIGLLFFRESRTRYMAGLPWCAIFVALFAVWPWSSRPAVMDLKNAATHSLVRKIATLRTSTADPAHLLPPELTLRALQSERPLLPFPHEDYIPVVLHRPVLAPVFQSFQASVPSLHRFYIQQMEKAGDDLDVMYGVNSDLDGVQSISRVPPVFEYLYRNFRLADDKQTGCRFCVLRRNATPFELKSTPVSFQPASTNHGLEIHPTAPAACSLLRLNIQIDYSLARFIGHTTPLDVSVEQTKSAVLNTRIVPIEVNKPFSTYVSLIPPGMFYAVFQHTSAPQFPWDTLRIDSHAVDWAGVAPSSIRVDRIDCITI